MEFIKQTIEYLQRELVDRTEKYKSLDRRRVNHVSRGEYAEAAECRDQLDKMISYFHCLDWLEGLVVVEDDRLKEYPFPAIYMEAYEKNKRIEIQAEELWDEFSFSVDDDLFSLQQVAGTSVMKRSDFIKAMKKAVEQSTGDQFGNQLAGDFRNYPLRDEIVNPDLHLEDRSIDPLADQDNIIQPAPEL